VKKGLSPVIYKASLPMLPVLSVLTITDNKYCILLFLAVAIVF